MQLSHHLLLASTTLATLLKFTHIFPVTLALLLLGIDTAGIKGSGTGREEVWLSDGGHDKRLYVSYPGKEVDRNMDMSEEYCRTLACK